MNRYSGNPIFYPPSLAVMAFLLVFCLATPILSAVNPALSVTGTVPLGSTRDEVIKVLGIPDSPLTSDYSFKKGTSEIMVVFNEKTDLVDSVIVIGKNPKYSIRGITGGSLKSDVAKIFGKPDKTFLYKKSGIECWFFPSKNISFCFTGGRVSSFSNCDCKH